MTGMMASVELFAQSGILVGKITDQKDSMAVPFASVQLFRDGKTSPGTATDLDGKYKLEKISPGCYTLKVKVIGYDSLTISDVTINANSRLTMNLEVSSKRDQYDRFMPIPNYYPKKKAPVIPPTHSRQPKDIMR